MTKLMKRSLIASVIIHLLLFFGISLQFSLELPQLPRPQHKSVDVDIIEKPEDIETENITVKETGGHLPKQVEKNDNSCDSYFGGIGITHTIDWDSLKFRFVVVKVHGGYPAEKAGIRVGDKIRSIDDKEIKGTVGTDVTLEVERDGKLYKTTITRGKICTDKIKEKQ